jgi:hypothetical protein
MADQLGVKWTRDMTPDDISAAVDRAEHGAVSGAPADGKGFSLRTLDYVKRALQDHESEALRAGRGDDARLLKNMRQELTGAVDAADATGGDYAKARAIWGGVQKSLDAIEQGKGFLKLHPEEIQALMAKADEGDRPFLQMGAARALEDVTENTKLNLDSVARVNGSLRIGKQIEAMFGKNRSARFNESLTPEKIATQTNRTVRGGSNTADKLADVEDSSIADDVLEAMAANPTARIIASWERWRARRRAGPSAIKGHDAASAVTAREAAHVERRGSGTGVTESSIGRRKPSKRQARADAPRLAAPEREGWCRRCFLAEETSRAISRTARKRLSLKTVFRPGS